MFEFFEPLSLSTRELAFKSEAIVPLLFEINSPSIHPVCVFCPAGSFCNTSGLTHPFQCPRGTLPHPALSFSRSLVFSFSLSLFPSMFLCFLISVCCETLRTLTDRVTVFPCASWLSVPQGSTRRHRVAAHARSVRLGTSFGVVFLVSLHRSCCTFTKGIVFPLMHTFISVFCCNSLESSGSHVMVSLTRTSAFRSLLVSRTNFPVCFPGVTVQP
jgi:hypothetical protein